MARVTHFRHVGKHSVGYTAITIIGFSLCRKENTHAIRAGKAQKSLSHFAAYQRSWHVLWSVRRLAHHLLYCGEQSECCFDRFAPFRQKHPLALLEHASYPGSLRRV